VRTGSAGEDASRKDRWPSAGSSACAADHRGDIRDRLPKAPSTKNGKRVALVGAGPSSLTVANDLLPLGYDVTIFERNAQPGGLMRVNIPAFRLPATVLDEECGYIIDMGANMQYGTTVESLKTLLDDGYDAVYVGSGAPKGKGTRPARSLGCAVAGAHRHRVARHVHFGHFEKMDPRVVIIGRGQHRDGLLPHGEALRCNRREGHRAPRSQALQGVAMGTRGCRGRARSKSSRTSRPKRFVDRERKARRHGVRTPAWSEDANGKSISAVEEIVMIPCDNVILAIGQDNAFPWIERDIGVEFDKKGMPVVDKVTHQSSHPRCSSVAMRRGDRRTSSGPSRTDTRRRSPSTRYAMGSR
jgi:NADPH-dependent glutamate synthase beta subunit-like oxidoreductase